MPHLVGHGHVGHRGGNVFACNHNHHQPVVNVILTVVHQGDDAGVQALEAATIVLHRRGGQFQEMSKKMCELS